jgi:transcriptional regulator with XRE-family HTH domain
MVRERKTGRRELRLGRAEYENEQEKRSVNDARGLFFLAAVRLDPRVLETLEPMTLDIFRRLFPDESRPLSQERTSKLASKLGFAEELADLDEPAAADGLVEANGDTSRYPEVNWRDPNPDPKQRKDLRKRRLARGLSLRAEAERLHLLPSELAEMERGCKTRDGLTSTPGAEPLRRALRRWGRPWHLTDLWCLDWALEQLRTWPPRQPVVNPLDRGMVTIVPSEPPIIIPAYRPQMQTRKQFLDIAHKTLDAHCDAIDHLMEESNLKPTVSMRSAHQHFDWLAGYQFYGWSQRRIAIAEGVDRAAVVRAINNLAKTIALKRRSQDDRDWTVERITAALQKARATHPPVI